MSLEVHIQEVVQTLYGAESAPDLQETHKEFEGDLTLVVFPFVRTAKKAPEAVAEEIGAALKERGAIANYNVVKGFLNMSLDRGDYLDAAKNFAQDEKLGLPAAGSQTATTFCAGPSGAMGTKR